MIWQYTSVALACIRPDTLHIRLIFSKARGNHTIFLVPDVPTLSSNVPFPMHDFDEAFHFYA